MRYPLLEIEREADPDGEWISYGVRMKLDLAGRRISLDEWSQLQPSARVAITELSAETDSEIATFTEQLDQALRDVGLEARVLPAEKLDFVANWRHPGVAPSFVSTFLRELGAESLWPGFDRFARYLVCTFARKGQPERAQRVLRQLGYSWA